MAEDRTIKICADHKEQVPLIWTFKFAHCEYWCPACGYKEGMFGAGIDVPFTKELEKSAKEWKEKALPFLRDEQEDWSYTIKP